MLTIDFVQASEILKPLVYLLIGIVIYSIFVFHFYRFIARKDIFRLNLNQYNRLRHPFFAKLLRVVFYIIEYILLFPLFAMFWFAIIAVFLSFMMQETVASHILLISIALVGAVRITAYYNEELSKDLAKMLPFALLGIYIIDVSILTFSKFPEFLKQIPPNLDLLLNYLIFIILLEFVLRISYLILGNPKKAEAQEPPQQEQQDEEIVEI